MANERVLDQIEKLELGIAVDDARDPADIHKFTSSLRTLYVTRLAALRVALGNEEMGEAFRAGASGRLRVALDRLDELHRDGFNFIKGILSSKISAADRLMVFTAYGWTSGEIGIFTDARREQMARQAVDATPLIANPAYRYPAADLLDLIVAQLAIVNANQPAATGGDALSLSDLLEVATDGDDLHPRSEQGRQRRAKPGRSPLTRIDPRTRTVIPRQTGGVSRYDHPLRLAPIHLKSKNLPATIQRLRNRDTPPRGRDSPVGRLTS